MLDAEIYHKTSRDSVPSILSNGLKCTVQGGHGQEESARRTNTLLNELRPEALRVSGVDRNLCTYGYLAVGGRVFDVDTGRLVPLDEWDVGDGQAKLRVDAEPAAAFVSDLEAYDEVATRIRYDGDDETVRKFARRYWQRLVGFTDLCTYYRLAGHTLIASPELGPRFPSRLERVEVLLTTDVPGSHVRPA